MAEDAMIAERFAVVRGDDHQRVVEQPLALELVEQAPELFIEEGDAIVVAVARHAGSSASSSSTLVEPR